MFQQINDLYDFDSNLFTTCSVYPLYHCIRLWHRIQWKWLKLSRNAWKMQWIWVCRSLWKWKLGLRGDSWSKCVTMTESFSNKLKLYPRKILAYSIQILQNWLLLLIEKVCLVSHQLIISKIIESHKHDGTNKWPNDLTLFLTDLVTWYTMRGPIPPSPGRNRIKQTRFYMS